MAYNYEYPYFNGDVLNSDWLIKKMKELEESVLGLENVKYLGENPVTDLNQLDTQSIAIFTAGTASINRPTTESLGLVYTNGEDDYIYQMFFDENGHRWFRINNGTWHDMDDLSNYSEYKGVTSSDAIINDAPNLSIYSVVNGNQPVAGNQGILFTYWLDALNTRLQIFVSQTNGNIWFRRHVTSGWQAWENKTPAFPVTLTYGGASITNVSNAPNMTFYNVPSTATNNPSGSDGWLFNPGIDNTNTQIFFDRVSGDMYVRSWKQGTGWTSWINKTLQGIQYMGRVQQNQLDTLPNPSVAFAYNLSSPVAGYGVIFTIGDSEVTINNQQMFFERGTGNYYFRRYANGAWQSWVKITNSTAPVALSLVTASITDAGTPVTLALEDEETPQTPKENIFTELESATSLKKTILPGQAFTRADEEAQSFADIIFTMWECDSDMLISNFELWDMETPLIEIEQEVREVVEHLVDIAPFTQFILMSIPPIDLPMWGDEFYDYEMPNGSSVRELDVQMSMLANELGFTYITFDGLPLMKNQNLLNTLGEEMYTDDRFISTVGKYIKKQVLSVN